VYIGTQDELKYRVFIRRVMSSGASGDGVPRPVQSVCPAVPCVCVCVLGSAGAGVACHSLFYSYSYSSTTALAVEFWLRPGSRRVLAREWGSELRAN